MKFKSFNLTLVLFLLLISCKDKFSDQDVWIAIYNDNELIFNNIYQALFENYDSLSFEASRMEISDYNFLENLEKNINSFEEKTLNPVSQRTSIEDSYTLQIYYDENLSQSKVSKDNILYDYLSKKESYLKKFASYRNKKEFSESDGISTKKDIDSADFESTKEGFVSISDLKTFKRIKYIAFNKILFYQAPEVDLNSETYSNGCKLVATKIIDIESKKIVGTILGFGYSNDNSKKSYTTYNTDFFEEKNTYKVTSELRDQIENELFKDYNQFLSNPLVDSRRDVYKKVKAYLNNNTETLRELESYEEKHSKIKNNVFGIN